MRVEDLNKEKMSLRNVSKERYEMCLKKESKMKKKYRAIQADGKW